MRICAIPGDDDYHPIVSKEDLFNVFLDEVNISKTYLMRVVDEYEGYIEYYVKGENRLCCFDDNMNSVTERLYGNVKIKFKK